jgi:hypothetical protein
VCVWAKESLEGCPKVTAGEGIILSEGAYGVACESDVGKPGSEHAISVPFAVGVAWGAWKKK